MKLALIWNMLFPALASSFQERVIHSAQVGECRLTVEADDQWHALRLRALHPQYKNCHIDKDLMLQVLRAALLQVNGAAPGAPYRSLFIGRIIDYPWLSQYLATAAQHDRNWDMKRGRPRSTEINQYVSNLLSRNELMTQLIPVFTESGYKIIRVTVEKVLVRTFADVPDYQNPMHPGRVPFDAMLWLQLEKRTD